MRTHFLPFSAPLQGMSNLIIRGDVHVFCTLSHDFQHSPSLPTLQGTPLQLRFPSVGGPALRPLPLGSYCAKRFVFAGGTAFLRILRNFARLL